MNEQLIVFGAGASYGSDINSTPPLGSSLFNELQKFNPKCWGAIDGNIADIFVEDFELGMTEMRLPRYQGDTNLIRAASIESSDSGDQDLPGFRV